MKKYFLLLVGSAALAGATFGLVACVGPVGVGVDVGPGYYAPGPWAWGHPGYHGGGYRGGWRR